MLYFIKWLETEQLHASIIAAYNKHGNAKDFADFVLTSALTKMMHRGNNSEELTCDDFLHDINIDIRAEKQRINNKYFEIKWRERDSMVLSTKQQNERAIIFQKLLHFKHMTNRYYFTVERNKITCKPIELNKLVIHPDVLRNFDPESSLAGDIYTYFSQAGRAIRACNERKHLDILEAVSEIMALVRQKRVKEDIQRIDLN